MKEKIGIEKLIELLNEFETPQSGVVFKSYDDYDGTFYGVDIDGETEIAWSDSYICGKRFQWVKWLVENDKIDLGLYREYMPNLGEDFSVESNIIMNLSIAIDPIGYLNYILK